MSDITCGTTVDDLISFIRKNYQPEEKVKETKDGGRIVFFRKSGKSLCYMETKNGMSKVTIVVGVSLNEKVKSANISKKTKEMFDSAKQYCDGKWLFFETLTKQEVEDIKSLLLIKKNPVK